MAGVWTVSFLIKFGAGVLGIGLTDLQNNTLKSDFYSAIFLAVESVITELIPLYFVMDPRFVKIFTLNFLINNILESYDDNSTLGRYSSPLLVNRQSTTDDQRAEDFIGFGKKVSPRASAIT